MPLTILRPNYVYLINRYALIGISAHLNHMEKVLNPPALTRR